MEKLETIKQEDLIVDILIEGEEWQQVISLAEAGADDRVYELDRESGSVRFGDGEHGRLPPTGSTVQATYRYGSGQDGNMLSISWIGTMPELNQAASVSITALGHSIRFQHKQGKISWRWRLASWLCDWNKKFMK